MQKTLAGHLEDLDLDEVVKVVALSKRSGVLVIESPEGDAELTFLEGRIVRGRMNGISETVGDLLVRAGILTDLDLVGVPGSTLMLEEVVRRAEERRSERRDLVARTDEIVAEHVRALAVRVMLFSTGAFHFAVSEDEPLLLRYPGDTALTLVQGVDAEDLAREAKKKRQQRRRDPLSSMGSPPGTQGGGGQLGGARDRARGEQVELYIVDDDDDFAETAVQRAVACGVAAKRFGDARAAVDAFEALDAGPEPRVMVVDLVMPRPTGRGILGGLDVLKRAALRGVVGRIFLALEADHGDAEGIAKSLGAAGTLRKPKGPFDGGAVVDDGALGAYLNPLLERLGRPPLAGEPIDLAGELKRELGDGTDWLVGEWRKDPVRIDEGQKSLDVLKSLLAEVNNPTFEEEIPLLVLRFASAFFTRGALFGIDRARDEIAGIGGFGLGVPDPGRLVHSIRLPIAADTVFTRCLRERAGVRQPFFESEWNQRLTSSLGGRRPREVYTAPLLSPRGVEAVLYADNATDGRAFPDIALLEIFLQQAGAALERSALVRQLDALRLPRAPAAE